jgi:hypothetical protein
VLKKLCASEEQCYKQFNGDSLEVYVPEYQGTLEVEDDETKASQSEFKQGWAFLRISVRIL